MNFKRGNNKRKIVAGRRMELAASTYVRVRSIVPTAIASWIVQVSEPASEAVTIDSQTIKLASYV